jgi:pimeloyl-ACP methyl ester carboxylesterase
MSPISRTVHELAERAGFSRVRVLPVDHDFLPPVPARPLSHRVDVEATSPACAEVVVRSHRKRPGAPVMTIATEIPGHVAANGLDIYVEQVGEGPDVLLIGGLGDTVESWQFQLDGLADRYRLTAFDNRIDVAPSERAFLEGFFLDIYTARAHNDGTVAAIIDEVLAFPHKQATEDVQRFLAAFMRTTRRRACRRSRRRRSCLPAGVTRRAALSSAAPSPT